ncbi:helix-hairpin-helix domain-containing protein [Algoriphagus halophytocola]|uniref:Helix-hairpin-helix domain-containing protein n=1 Tax=Algoriphagus halophytocola TaxID=2991499 RepID=A0ABY6MJQ6_9BACT|nr:MULTISPECIES: helix-hairpin-helix domain-containing protein [unclassified Algoriphagus]UZD24020.1 helix-hairpin-helix domain-containing protein [Algoriphagus sp. TR-M5]WBL41392.1 helix-hairpin-helix domain-containing protein [Algoriphagus sp. TR-M9]
MLRIALVFWFIVLSLPWVLAQNPPREEIDIEDFIERLFPVQDDDLDFESIYEVLFQLYQNPIAINQASAEVLAASYLLAPDQINNLIAYRENNGPLISLYELQAVPGFDLNTIQRILPFLSISAGLNTQTQPLWKRIVTEDQAYLLFRHRRVWEKRRGFTPADTSSTGKVSSRYLGDPNDLYLRFRIQHPRDFSIGITLDKDPGEQFKWETKSARYGFNFLSFHLVKYYIGKWKTIALGDFQAQFGQGLVFGAGYGLGKGAETVPTVRKSSVGILPYTAALEFGFFRGTGITYQSGKWQASLIASFAPRDGRIAAERDTLENEDLTISSFNQSGLHRTESELSTKNQFREFSLGGNVQFAPNSKLQVGTNYLFTRFDHPWVKTPTPYNQFDFAGKQNSVASLYLNYNWKNFFFFGESAQSASGGTGTILGLVSSLSRQIDFSLLWRKYSRDFHSFYANAFAEATRPANEQGVYLGVEIKPISKWKINAYYDFFKFPWLRYRVYAPSVGYEWLGRITFSPNRSLSAFFQIREEQKDRNLADSGEPALTYQVKPVNKVNGTLSFQYQVNKAFFIRSRILFSRINFNEKKSTGFLMFQDAQYQFGKSRITGRIALFDTDDYDSRLYAYENNVLWTFSIPPYFGQGMRYYVVAQHQLTPQLTAYFRFAKTNYTDRESISSGLQTIEGSAQTETTFMLRYMLHP